MRPPAGSSVNVREIRQEALAGGAPPTQSRIEVSSETPIHNTQAVIRRQGTAAQNAR